MTVWRCIIPPARLCHLVLVVDGAHSRITVYYFFFLYFYSFFPVQAFTWRSSDVVYSHLSIQNRIE